MVSTLRHCSVLVCLIGIENVNSVLLDFANSIVAGFVQFVGKWPDIV